MGRGYKRVKRTPAPSTPSTPASLQALGAESIVRVSRGQGDDVYLAKMRDQTFGIASGDERSIDLRFEREADAQQFMQRVQEFRSSSNPLGFEFTRQGDIKLTQTSRKSSTYRSGDYEVGTKRVRGTRRELTQEVRRRGEVIATRRGELELAGDASMRASLRALEERVKQDSAKGGSALYTQVARHTYGERWRGLKR